MSFAPKLGVRTLSLLLCVLMAVSLLQPVSAAPTQLGEPEMCNACVIRNSPSAFSDSIGQLEDGTVLNILGQSGDYYLVDCYDMDGYIHQGQVKYENDLYYVNCKPMSADTLTMEYQPLSDAISQRSALLQLAQSKLGCPYVYGAMGPNGFDCSGFVSYVCKKNGISLERTADMQMQNGLIVSLEGIQLGDLVFFRDPGSPWLATHVGIYVGDNQFIHADSGGVRYTSMDNGYYASRLVCARRVINVSAAQVCAVQTPLTDYCAPVARSAGGFRTVN